MIARLIDWSARNLMLILIGTVFVCRGRGLSPCSTRPWTRSRTSPTPR